MKTVLCFGDSNTWGFIPESITEKHPRRHPHNVRWTGVLAGELGEGFRVIEEGQNGRTTVHDDPFALARNARSVLPALLESHKPLDAVVMMLGTNDLKAVFAVSPPEIAMGVRMLAQMILSSEVTPRHAAPRLLLVCPPIILPQPHLPDVAVKFPDASRLSMELPRHYEALAASLGCAYLNAQSVVSTSAVDGIHLDAQAHAQLGLAVAQKVKTFLLDTP
jgi:lysophospholipase L1-like esterase